MKKWLLIIPVLLLVALSTLFFRKQNPREILHPKVGPIVESIYGLGTVQSDNIYTLKLGVTTTVKKLFVKEGDKVLKGQRLLQFDGEGTGIQYAPFDGSITQINYFAGETVFPQSPILTLTDLDHRYISVALDQEGALRIRPQQSTLLNFESIENQVFEGKVRAVFPRQGQLMAHIDAPTLLPEILPGMTADVAIVVNRKDRAILIPLKAIHQGQIKLKKDSDFAETKVQLGIVDAEWAEVLSPTLLETDLIAPQEN